MWNSLYYNNTVNKLKKLKERSRKNVNVYGKYIVISYICGYSYKSRRVHE